jgi:hypothetical protein
MYPSTCVLAHFCEQHGPSIVFTSQLLVSSSLSSFYTFPESFNGISSKEEITKWTEKFSDFGHLHFDFGSPPEDGQLESNNEDGHDHTSMNLSGLKLIPRPAEQEDTEEGVILPSVSVSIKVKDETNTNTGSTHTTTKRYVSVKLYWRFRNTV